MGKNFSTFFELFWACAVDGIKILHRTDRDSLIATNMIGNAVLADIPDFGAALGEEKNRQICR